MNYYNIIIPAPIDKVFTYKSERSTSSGCRVIIPFGNRKVVGVVESLTDDLSDDIIYKEVIDILDKTPLFNSCFIKFLKAVSKHYLVPLGSVLKGSIATSLLTSQNDTTTHYDVKNVELCELTQSQAEVYNKIKFFLNNRFSVHLIHGITGSGKTEIYLKLIKDVIAQKKQAIYLVPEIALTSQLVTRISETIGISVDPFHSKLSFKKRKNLFWGFRQGNLPLLIGARSALFVPPHNIGLIIVDEEHESSYKQEETPAYNLRDMAVLYSKIFNIPVVLGSATPSVESYYNAHDGKKYFYYILNKRFSDYEKPKIHIIDMKTEEKIDGIISLKLYNRINHIIKTGGQAILFLNKKGYSRTLLCSNCGEPYRCDNCSVSMTYYKSKKYSKCHYCGVTASSAQCCKCGGVDFFEYGFGTEKVFELAEELFKEKIVKIDRETITSQRKLDKILKDFSEKKYNIMVGTQLIAKGLNFPSLSLVGVIDIDNIFSFPDFRAYEKAYQILLQVSGRAGRFGNSGEVFIQTYKPDQEIFNIIRNNPNSFYNMEIDKRKPLNYPPYGKLMRVIISYTQENYLYEVGDIIAKSISNIKTISVMGPSTSPIYKIKNRYRINLLIKSKTYKNLHTTGKLIKTTFDKVKKGSMSIKLDIDPQFFM